MYQLLIRPECTPHDNLTASDWNETALSLKMLARIASAPTMRIALQLAARHAEKSKETCEARERAAKEKAAHEKNMEKLADARQNPGPRGPLFRRETDKGEREPIQLRHPFWDSTPSIRPYVRKTKTFVLDDHIYRMIPGTEND